MTDIGIVSVVKRVPVGCASCSLRAVFGGNPKVRFSPMLKQQDAPPNPPSPVLTRGVATSQKQDTLATQPHSLRSSLPVSREKATSDRPTQPGRTMKSARFAGYFDQLLDNRVGGQGDHWW